MSVQRPPPLDSDYQSNSDDPDFFLHFSTNDSSGSEGENVEVGDNFVHILADNPDDLATGWKVNITGCISLHRSVRGQGLRVDVPEEGLGIIACWDLFFTDDRLCWKKYAWKQTTMLNK